MLECLLTVIIAEESADADHKTQGRIQKFTNVLIRKEKKHSYSSQWEKKNWEKLDFVL